MAPSSNMPPLEPVPPTTVARRSLRLRDKQSTHEPQELHRSARVQTTTVADQQPQSDTHNHTTTSEENETARMIAVDCLLRLQYTDKRHLKYSSLIAPSALIVSTLTPRVDATQQTDRNCNEKENEDASVPRRTTDATHVVENAPTKVSLTRKTPKPMKVTAATTGKRANTNTLKRKATDEDTSEVNGPALNVKNVESRAVKRPRTKFTAEPSERVTRGSSAKAEVAGTATEKIPAQERASEVGLAEQPMASTGIDNSLTNSNTEDLFQAADSPADSKAQEDTGTPGQAKRPRLALIIPARAATESTPTALGSGIQSATNTESSSQVESAVTATEAEDEVMVRVPGGKGVKAAA